MDTQSFPKMDNSAQYSEMRNILARRATQNVFQTVILDAADLTQKRIFVQPLYPVPNLGQEKVSNWTLHRTLKALARIVEHIRMAQYISQLDHGHDAVLIHNVSKYPSFLYFFVFRVSIKKCIFAGPFCPTMPRKSFLCLAFQVLHFSRLQIFRI